MLHAFHLPVFIVLFFPASIQANRSSQSSMKEFLGGLWHVLLRPASTHPRTPPQTRPSSIAKMSSCAALKMPPDMHAYLGWGSALEAAADHRGLERQRGIALKRLRPCTAC
jgi:hypothetical protein